LKFANRAKNIKNEAYINEDNDQRALLRKYQIELKKLKQELFERSQAEGGSAYNPTDIMQLE
jgi:kinesin family protein 3/17